MSIEKQSEHVGPEAIFEGMAGAFVALMTPFTPQNTVNLEMVDKQVAYYLDCGIRGFYVTGGTGEGLLLSMEERRAMVERVVASNAGRAKVVAHIGCLNTDDAVKLARHAEKSGVDWISAVPPVYFGQSFAAATRHYTRIASATALPFMIYANNGSVIDPARDARLFEIPNIRGMKYTGMDFYALQRLVWRLPRPTIFFSGQDQLFVPAIASGCIVGCIGTTQNIIPRHFVRMHECAARNDFAQAIQVQREANRVLELMVSDENWSYRKAMVRYLGLDVGPARPPYTPLGKEEYEEFCARIEAQGILRRDDAVKGGLAE